jgi:hypothetical protein
MTASMGLARAHTAVAECSRYDNAAGDRFAGCRVLCFA